MIGARFRQARAAASATTATSAAANAVRAANRSTGRAGSRREASRADMTDADAPAVRVALDGTSARVSPTARGWTFAWARRASDRGAIARGSARGGAVAGNA
jgi:hypothetical protein